MNINQKMLSSLFSLFAGSTFLAQSSSSQAATCQWDSLIVNPGTITECCAMTVSSSGLTWNTVTYTCNPATNSPHTFTDFSISMPVNTLTQCTRSFAWTGLAHKAYTVTASGGDSHGFWSASIPSSQVTP